MHSYHCSVCNQGRVELDNFAKLRAANDTRIPQPCMHLPPPERGRECVCGCGECSGLKCVFCAQPLDLFGSDRRALYYPRTVQLDVCVACAGRQCTSCGIICTTTLHDTGGLCTDCLGVSAAFVSIVAPALPHVIALNVSKYVGCFDSAPAGGDRRLGHDNVLCE